MPHTLRALALALLAVPLALASPLDDPELEPPVLGAPIARGILVTTGPPFVEAIPPARVADGRIDDWIGESLRLAGHATTSRGELVYQDHLFDASGADDGADAKRLALAAPLHAVSPRLARSEAIAIAAGAELGVPDPTGFVAAESQYGDARVPDDADLLEVRVAADAERVWILARTTVLTASSAPALLILFDEDGVPPGTFAPRSVPWGSGLATARADVAVLVDRAGARAVDLATGATIALPGAAAAVRDAGYDNAIEVALPRATVARAARPLDLAVAIGVSDGAGGLAPIATGEGQGQLANVAFRRERHVSTSMDRDQALALHEGSLDAFFARADLDLLAAGATIPARPGPGYHERVFQSTPAISREREDDGIHQHYGLHVPRRWDPARETPMTLWLHWRGGGAHDHAVLTPRLVETLSEDRGAILVSPRGRGSSTWFVGPGHADVLEAWADARSLVAIDAARTTVAGYSMGGYGSWLFAGLYPDRFAAAYSVAGAVTQGAWLGASEDGWDVVQANEGDANAELAYRLVPNLRHVPFAIHQGTNDELVPVTGVARMADRMRELGYPHRLTLFPGYEHYTQAILDEWAEGARYLDPHARPENPARVTLARPAALERAVATLGGDITLRVGRAYWLAIEPRDPRPDDPTWVATADVRSLAIPDAHALAPEAGAAAPGHSTPFAMSGLARVPLPAAEAPANAFTADLARVRELRLDLARMSLDADETLHARVATDGPVTLALAGEWTAPPHVDANGRPVPAAFAEGTLTFALPAGEHAVRVRA